MGLTSVAQHRSGAELVGILYPQDYSKWRRVIVYDRLSCTRKYFRSESFARTERLIYFWLEESFVNCELLLEQPTVLTQFQRRDFNFIMNIFMWLYECSR
jgi:hypothetical protein